MGPFSIEEPTKCLAVGFSWLSSPADGEKDVLVHDSPKAVD
jgi:hypothetical protein